MDNPSTEGIYAGASAVELEPHKDYLLQLVPVEGAYGRTEEDDLRHPDTDAGTVNFPKGCGCVCYKESDTDKGIHQ